MNTQLFIENYELDVSADISSLLTFELDSIKDFAARGTTWSKTIVLPGTSNNNKLFGHIFQVGQANSHVTTSPNVNYNFNASKSADVILFQDQMQTFKGVLRLLQINITKGKPEYEVALFGEIALLNVELSGGKLENLDFSAYDHIYNEVNVVNSWDAAPGSGYYYPLIDYGTASALKHNWDIRTFRPALYVKEYIDKMFTAAGFRYSSALFETTRFKRLVVPFCEEKMRIAATSYLDVEADGTQVITTGFPNNIVLFPTINTLGNFVVDIATFPGAFRYDDPLTITGDIALNISGTVNGSSTGGKITMTKWTADSPPGVLLAQASLPSGTNVPFSLQLTATTDIEDGDIIVVSAFMGGQPISILSAQLVISPTAAEAVEVTYGDPISMNLVIPKNVRQIDFFSSIIKLFNLYVYEDRFDNRLINITPYIDFYSVLSSDAVDWTYKLNRDKTIQVKPMSEINAKKYEFQFKSDSDYYNELHRKRYSEGYGDYTFDSNFEFAEQSKKVELIFSATPLVGYDGEEKVYSTIFKLNAGVEERTESNIRILQTKKVTGVASWDLLDGATVLDSLTDYGYAGHYDDPDAPANDIHFGVPKELFFALVTGSINVTQFNVYWSAYMAEITDKDSKLVSAWFRLSPLDILQLDYSKKVHIDGVLFRLSKINDYNATRQEDCKVELLKVNYLLY